MCILGGGIQGNYELNIVMQGIGYAMIETEGANSFAFEIVVTDFEPKFVYLIIFLYILIFRWESTLEVN